MDNVPPEAREHINRELSLLAFHSRVHAMARDPQVPLLEQLKFLCISANNLDEFFEVRLARLKQQQELDTFRPDPDGLSLEQLLNALRVRIEQLVSEQYATLNEHLLPSLKERGIRLLRRGDWTAEQTDWLRENFVRQTLPVLTPLGLDPARPFPHLRNKSLNFVLRLRGKDALKRKAGMGILQAPRSLPRLIRLPDDADGDGCAFVFLSSTIREFAGHAFPGMSVQGCHQFRVTRNSNLFFDDEETEDLMSALRGSLAARRHGHAVRLEVSTRCPEDTLSFLQNYFALGPTDVFRVDGPVNLNRLMTLYELVDRPDLKYPHHQPLIPAEFETDASLLAVIAQRDVLLHHPFDSFLPVVSCLKEAAADPDVLAIKQTLYRTGPNSVMVDALVDAARAGKEVTVIIELRARFDEAFNIELANRLQEAGAHVVYGVVGKKTHAKLMLIVRREGEQLQRYMHLGTGNYHPGTARLYCDYGLLTADSAIGEDVHHVFLQLTGLSEAPKLERLVQAPFKLHKFIVRRIKEEAANARAGKPARVLAKMNALIEPGVIQALYAASQAGVQVDLIIRGTCCIRPGVAGLSENITVRSVVGRYLEHDRVWMFHNTGEIEVYASSADWMDRNFFRRIEVCFPIRKRKIKRRIVANLELYLADNTQAWELHSDGNYRRLQPAPESAAVNAQETLLEQATEQRPY